LGNYYLSVIPLNKECNEEGGEGKIKRKIKNLNKIEYFSKLIEGNEFKKGIKFCLEIVEENEGTISEYKITAIILPLLQNKKYEFLLNKEGNFEQKVEEK